MTLSTAIDKLTEPRAVPFNAGARCFYVYRIVDGRTYPLVVDCSTVDEAVERGKVHCFHKDHLLVREVGSGADNLHLFAIKKRSAPTYVYRDHAYQRQDRLFASLVCAFSNPIPAFRKEGEQ